nr:C2 calcium-dependent membrane targeting [Tanacetum cinerariifolium]
SICNEFNVGQKIPPTSFWTTELLKEREYEEINARGIGKGELQGPFIKEDDPMPKDEDQYCPSLHYKNRGSEGKSCFDLNGDSNDEPQQVVKEFESSKKGNDFERPNFSLGVTQNFQMVLSLETPVTDRNTRVLGSAHQLEPIKAMSLSMCKPVLKEEDMVHGRGKRKYTKSQATRVKEKLKG